MSIEGDENLEVQTERRPYEDTTRRQPSRNHGEGSLEKKNSTENTLIMNVYPRGCKKINVCCLIQMASRFAIVRLHNNKAIIIASSFLRGK